MMRFIGFGLQVAGFAVRRGASYAQRAWRGPAATCKPAKVPCRLALAQRFKINKANKRLEKPSYRPYN